MYDIFLGGPFEPFALRPFKSLIKQAFPALKIYDPEDAQKGNWFEWNLDAIRHTKIFVAFIPSIPCPGVGPEIGIYYEHKLLMGRKPNIIIIWPESVQPTFGKEVADKLGTIVSTTEEAIEMIKILTEATNDTPGPTAGNGV